MSFLIASILLEYLVIQPFNCIVDNIEMKINNELWDELYKPI